MPAGADPQLPPSKHVTSEASQRNAGHWLRAVFHLDFFCESFGRTPHPPTHPRTPCHLLAMAFVSGACSLALSWAMQGHTPWLSGAVALSLQLVFR